MDIKSVREKFPQYADLSDEQLVAGLHKKFYSDMPFDEFAGEVGLSAPQPKRGTFSNIALGALKGASDIGATLLSPLDATGLTGMSSQERRDSLKQFFADTADTGSVAFKGGELGADIAGTAGAGGLIAKGLRAVPVINQAAAPLINAIESSGFVLGKPAATTVGGKVANAATRAAGGAITGAASAGLIDPDTAGTGAVIGGVLPGGVAAAKGLGSGVRSMTKTALGASTGAGADAISQAFKAGKDGNQAFVQNMRGQMDMTSVLDDAKSALSSMRSARGAEYRAGMANVTSDKTVLDFSPILKSADDAMGDTMFNGVVKKENAAKMAQKIKEVVNEWGGLDPARFHTPEGLDALKQRIGDLRDASSFGTPERRVADQVYNSIKKQITDQSPEYAKTMKAYEEASDLLGEIQRALSLGEKASADTAMRKLQSLMRNNVNTNYGNRLDLAKELEKFGGKDILPAVAGQALSSGTPRGLQGLAATGAGIAGISNPAFLAALPFQSPRLMGEAAYALGRASSGAGKVAQPLLGNPSIGQRLADPMNFGLLAVPPVLMGANP